MRGVLLFGLWLATAAHAAPHRASHKVRTAHAGPMAKAWLVKKAGEGVWCSFASQQAAQDAIAAEKFDADNRAIVLAEQGRLVAIQVSNEDDDGYADDLYRFDPGMRLVRMERTGRSDDGPAFSLTYGPDSGGALALTPASRAALERLDDADRDTDISDWPRFRGFDRMPFRGLITARPLAVRKGCAPSMP
jgi:hypothetical protein